MQEAGRYSTGVRHTMQFGDTGERGRSRVTQRFNDETRDKRRLDRQLHDGVLLLAFQGQVPHFGHAIDRLFRECRTSHENEFRLLLLFFGRLAL